MRVARRRVHPLLLLVSLLALSRGRDYRRRRDHLRQRRDRCVGGRRARRCWIRRCEGSDFLARSTNSSYRRDDRCSGCRIFRTHRSAYSVPSRDARMGWVREERALYMTWRVAIRSAVLLEGGLAAGRVGFAFAMFMVAQFLGGASTPVIQSWFNEEIEGDNRATLLSFGSTFATFGATAGLPVQGLIVDSFGMGSAWQGAGMLAMLQAPIFLALRRKRG